VKLLSKALQNTQEFPDEVRSMLKAIMPYSLGVAHAERSLCQHKVVDLLSTAFVQMEEGITGRIAEAEAKTQTAGSSHAEILQRKTASEAVLQERTEAVATKKTEVEQANATVKTDEEQVEKAAVQLKSSSEQLEKTNVQLERVKAVQNESYAPLQEGAVDLAAVTGHLDKVVALGKELGFDESLLLSVPAVLGKPAEARTPFDLMVLQTFQEQATKRIDSLAEDVTKCEADKSRDADALETEKVDCDAAKSKFGELEVELAAAVAEEAKQRDDMAAANAAVKDLEASSLTAADALVSERAQLSSFREEVLEKFRELKEPPPPPEPAPVIEVEGSTPVVEAEATEATAQKEMSEGADNMPVDETPATGTEE